MSRLLTWLCGSDQQEPPRPGPASADLARSLSSLSVYQPEIQPQLGYGEDGCEMYTYRHDRAGAYGVTVYNPYAGRGGGGRNLYRQPITRRKLVIPQHLDDTDM
ncbi:unnamed protein product [Orchesella dallaii]|uniref:Uncharacterized protein n=1 Tax=Orchesella dallaii TaxID=48710 RepID=A0ABP1S006_9HEXA